MEINNKIICSDVLVGLKSLPDESVDCVVTSPPYWGLRDYGTAKWEGGDEQCDHQVGRFEYPATEKQKSNAGSASHQAKDVCPKCGAKRIDKQFGLEKTPEEYVSKLVEIFHEVKRVLKRDGTVWLNLGDSYAGGGGISGVPDVWESLSTNNRQTYANESDPKRNAKAIGLKQKDLVGIPWRCAFALQSDGWWLRQDIIWSKPNPMPESVTDRCTKAHEYVFLLTKCKDYFYDAEAIKEPQADISKRRAFSVNHLDVRKDAEKDAYAISGVAQDATYERLREKILAGEDITRNKHSVWTITTKCFSGAHFAVFPEDLIEPMIKAGTSEKGVCPDCGKAWVRVVEKELAPETVFTNTKNDDFKHQRTMGGGTKGCGGTLTKWRNEHPAKTVEWRAQCKCKKEPVPALVLDPFMGSGTVALVSRKLLRHYVGIELNPEYVAMARNRLNAIPGRLEDFDGQA